MSARSSNSLPKRTSLKDLVFSLEERMRNERLEEYENNCSFNRQKMKTEVIVWVFSLTTWITKKVLTLSLN